MSTLMADVAAERPSTTPHGTRQLNKSTDESFDKKCAKVFKRFDMNGDGVIQRFELTLVLRSLSWHQFTNKKIEKVMDEVDTNKDGMISQSEFTSWLCGSERGNQVMDMALCSTGPSKVFESSTYTGVAAKGGPNADDRNEVDLPHATSTKLNDGHTTFRFRRSRVVSLPPMSAVTEGPKRTRKDSDLLPIDWHRGPERFFYDKSSYTGTAAHGGAAVDDRATCDFTQMVRSNLNDGQTTLKVGHMEDMPIQSRISLLRETKEPAPPPPPPPNPYMALSDDIGEATQPPPLSRVTPPSHQLPLSPQRRDGSPREVSRGGARKPSLLQVSAQGSLPQEVQPTAPQSPPSNTVKRPHPNVQKVSSQPVV